MYSQLLIVFVFFFKVFPYNAVQSKENSFNCITKVIRIYYNRSREMTNQNSRNIQSTE